MYIYIYIYYTYIYYSWFGYTRLQIFIQVVVKRINRYKDFYMICVFGDSKVPENIFRLYGM